VLSEALERMRASSALSNDPAAVESLARLADGAPPSQQRAEARMLVAEAWLGRMHRTDDALRVLRLVAEDPAADALTSRLAERELVDTWIAQGRLGEAAREVRLHPERVDLRFAKQVLRLERRQMLAVAATAELVLFGILVAFALVRAARRHGLQAALVGLRSLAPIVAAFCLYVAAVGGLLATQFEKGNAAPFVWLGGILAPVVLMARAWGAVGSPERPARIGRALLSAASAVAAAFLLLATYSPLYLEGFGL
jgi:hypothetical protein